MPTITVSMTCVLPAPTTGWPNVLGRSAAMRSIVISIGSCAAYTHQPLPPPESSEASGGVDATNNPTIHRSAPMHPPAAAKATNPHPVLGPVQPSASVAHKTANGAIEIAAMPHPTRLTADNPPPSLTPPLVALLVTRNDPVALAQHKYDLHELVAGVPSAIGCFVGTASDECHWRRACRTQDSWCSLQEQG